eukprot:jgi/Bigna1/79849/fgenesh1_pg.65_\
MWVCEWCTLKNEDELENCKACKNKRKKRKKKKAEKKKTPKKVVKKAKTAPAVQRATKRQKTEQDPWKSKDDALSRRVQQIAVRDMLYPIPPRVRDLLVTRLQAKTTENENKIVKWIRRRDKDFVDQVTSKFGEKSPPKDVCSSTEWEKWKSLDLSCNRELIDWKLIFQSRGLLRQPEVGGRIVVRFDDGVWYSGTLASLEKLSKAEGGGAQEEKKKGEGVLAGNGLVWKIVINYDDATSETTVYPDKDNDILLMPIESSVKIKIAREEWLWKGTTEKGLVGFLGSLGEEEDFPPPPVLPQGFRKMVERAGGGPGPCGWEGAISAMPCLSGGKPALFWFGGRTLQLKPEQRTKADHRIATWLNKPASKRANNRFKEMRRNNKRSRGGGGGGGGGATKKPKSTAAPTSASASAPVKLLKEGVHGESGEPNSKEAAAGGGGGGRRSSPSSSSSSSSSSRPKKRSREEEEEEEEEEEGEGEKGDNGPADDARVSNNMQIEKQQEQPPPPQRHDDGAGSNNDQGGGEERKAISDAKEKGGGREGDGPGSTSATTRKQTTTTTTTDNNNNKNDDTKITELSEQQQQQQQEQQPTGGGETARERGGNAEGDSGEQHGGENHHHHKNNDSNNDNIINNNNNNNTNNENKREKKDISKASCRESTPSDQTNK